MESCVTRSDAALLNERVLRGLRKAFEADPEVDLTSRIPASYSKRLAERKAKCQREDEPPPKRIKCQEQPSYYPEDDARRRLDGVSSATILFPLSEPVQKLLDTALPNSSLTEKLHCTLRQSTVLWKPQLGSHKIVLGCDSDIALKIVRDTTDTTQYTTLQYLEKHLPDVPAPRALGCVHFGKCYLIFMSFVPGTTLAAVWPMLDHSLKLSVQKQLNDIFTDLRSYSPPSGARFGGTANEGCKDLRRHVRQTQNPMRTVGEFDDWQFSNPHYGSAIYIELLRKLSPPLPQELVFSHNDLRPANIFVEHNNGECRITGIIDWEYSGFYPAYYESTKVMNCITPNEDNDWYLFIPECLSPVRYAQKWLLDAFWWKHVQ